MPGHCTDPLDSSSSIPIGSGYSRTKTVTFRLKNNLPDIYKKEVRSVIFSSYRTHFFSFYFFFLGNQ